MMSILLALAVWGCQCVPGLDTEQEITPSQYSNVMCVNCAPMFEKVKVVVGEYLLHSSLDYQMEEGYKYFNVAPGVTNFVIMYKNDSVLYNGVANLSKAVPYTFLIIQMQRRIKGILLYDTIGIYSPTNSYFRFVNMAINSSSTLLFQIEQQYPIYFPLGFKSYTRFLTTYPARYKITIRDVEKDSTLVEIKNFELLAGKGYSFIFRGDFQDKTEKYIPSLLIVKHDFDEIYLKEQKK
ncbi:MAG: hypothetical protein ACPLPX_08405 [Candidatus Kapaibacteriota bacterium]